MNFVFWILVILAVIAIWFLLAPVFKLIGKSIIGLFNHAKRGIK